MSTNNTSGVKNICEFATRPLYSADDWSQKNHSFPEHQHQVHEGAFYQLFVQLSSATNFEPIFGNIDVPLDIY